MSDSGSASPGPPGQDKQGESPWVLLVGGVSVVLAVVGISLRLVRVAKAAATLDLVEVLPYVLIGLGSIGGSVVLFRILFARWAFERHVAWRYLRELKGEIPPLMWGSLVWILAKLPGNWALVVSFVSLFLAGASRIALHFIAREGMDEFLLPPSAYERYLSQIFIGLMIVGALALLVGLLRRVFSVFTTISIYGVFIGTTALVVVLSVMSGFESELKRKILGAYAHVVVSAEEGGLPDYARLVTTIREAPGVVAAAPFVENEAMALSPSNLAGVLLRGIDPHAASDVTELSKNIEAGSMENLVHPERIERQPLGPFLRKSPPWEQPLFDGGPGAPGLDWPALDAGLPNRPGDGSAPGKREEGVIVGGILLPPELVDKPDKPDNADKPARGKKPKPESKVAEPELDVEPVSPPPAPRRRDLPGIIIGRELSKNLRLSVGDDVHVVSPQGDIGPTGPVPKSRLFRVAAVFYSGMYEYDTKFVYITIPVAQKFFRLGDKVTGIEVKGKSVDEAPEIAAELRQTLAKLHGAQASNLRVKDWQELNRNLFSALKLEKAAMFVVLTFIVLVASFSIVSSLIMIVIEKAKEIAILKSMGATNGSITLIFVLDGFYIGITGVTMGLLVGVGMCLYLQLKGFGLDPDIYYISRLPVAMRFGEIFAVAWASLGLSIAATIYPALMAAWMRPVDGLRYD